MFAYIQIRKLKASYKAFESMMNIDNSVMLYFSKLIEDIQENLYSLAITLNSLRLHEIVETLIMKIKFYANAIEAAHMLYSQEQEIEKTYQFVRTKNVKISGLLKTRI